MRMGSFSATYLQREKNILECRFATLGPRNVEKLFFCVLGRQLKDCHIKKDLGSGCDTVASYTRDPWFESSHWQILFNAVF